MHQLSANVEILVDDEHCCAEVACPDGSMEPHAPRSKDHDIGFIVPLNPWSAGRGGLRQRFASA